MLGIPVGELAERVTPSERARYRAFDMRQGLPDRHLDRTNALLRRTVRSLLDGKDTKPLRDFIADWWELPP